MRDEVVVRVVPNHSSSATNAFALATPKADFLIHQLFGRGGWMSLKKARMARRVACGLFLTGCSAMGANGICHAQAPAVPSAPTPPVIAAPQSADGPRDVLKVRPLQIPNTSLAGIGTQKLPQDAVEGRLPDAVPLPFGPDRDEGWTYSTKQWVAPVFFHQPTYYEDQMLENHGHEAHPMLQPMISGARFYTGILFTPYLYCLNGPLEDISSAGRYRPGSVAPALRQRAPYDGYALGAQALSVGGGVLLLKP